MTSPYHSGTINYYSLSGYTRIDVLAVWGYKWGGYGAGVGAALTFGFPSSGAAWIGDYLGGEPFDGFQPFPNAQKSAARQALGAWSAVANITFTEVADTASN